MSKHTKTPTIEVDILLIDSEEVKNLVANHLETVTTILDTYEDLLDVLDDGVKTELLAAVDNLTSSIDSLQEIDQDFTFEQLVEKLENVDASNIETDKLLALCDEDEILDWVKTNKPGFILLKTESGDMEDKIRTFLETEIYPHYNDQVNNILF